ncbi:hypothetical protein HanIR_Chr01g0026601 [Helianthus annuus]|nr:hypothetical protein HanIR_Chr01g0026601 [Helianthus annuus]
MGTVCFDFVDFKDVLSQRYKEGTTIGIISSVTLLFATRLRTLTKKMVLKENASILNFRSRVITIFILILFYLLNLFPLNFIKFKRFSFFLIYIWSIGFRDVEVDLPLWDDYAKDMCSYMLSQDREAHVVIAVHFGAVKTYKGKWGISNNFDGTRVFINDNFDQILTFKESEFIAKLSASSESSSHVGSYVLCSVEDEFMKNDVFSPIAYLGSIIQQKRLLLWELL